MRVGIVAMALALLAAPISTPAPAAEVPAGWKAYSNVILGYSISYPSGWRVDPKYEYVGFGPDHPIEGVAFEIPAAMAKGTNLSSNLTNVSVESRKGPGACDAHRFIPDPENVHDASDAGAGNFYDITVFVLKDSAPCLAVRYFIHSTNIANYDPGTVRPYSRQWLVKQFDAVRATLAVTPAH
jgi:hypothetical protein